MPQQEQLEAKVGYIKVNLNYAPKTNGKKFAEWCEKSGFTPLNGGRRAWSSSLGTYLRGASGVAYADGEPFLFYEEDLVDITALIQEAVNEGRVAELDYWLRQVMWPNTYLQMQEDMMKRKTELSGGSNNE